MKGGRSTPARRTALEISHDGLERARSFDRIADEYERVRPGYPAQLFDDMLEEAQLPPASTILEIGAGTGRASLALLDRGFSLVAVEPGEHMAEILRARTASSGRAEVLCSTFEEAPLEQRRFPLVFAAQSFHWLDPATRLSRVAGLLETGGCLAVFGNVPRPAAAGPVEDEIQAAYARHMPGSTGSSAEPWYASHRSPFFVEASESQEFLPPRVCKYEFEMSYLKRDYLALLRTYSDHQVLPAASLEGLLAEIGAAIDRAGGRLAVHYLCTLFTVQLVHPAPRV